MISSLEVARTLKTEENIDNIRLTGVSTKNNPLPNTITFITNYHDDDAIIIAENTTTIFITNLLPNQHNFRNVIYASNPRSAYGQIAKTYFESPVKHKIEQSAIISPSSVIGEKCYIGHHVVIEENVVIGSNSTINHGTVICKGTVIGNYCSIGTDTSIGGPGFGYDVDENGAPFRISHLGNVNIGNYVDIGANVSIARGTIESTSIADYVKIDDCVFIAHNVKIGEGSFIIAGAEISGSVTVGKNVWISPEVTVINKVTIGDNALVGIGSTVTKNIEAGMIAVGSPAKSIKKRYE